MCTTCRLLGPIRVLPTLREELEEPQDSLMRDTPMDAPSPPLLDTVAPPSPLPQFPLPHPPSSGRGAGSEAQGFDTEEFLTQRAPMRPSQVVTEQTMVVHSWLQAERDRQGSMCKRRRLGGGVAEVPPPDEVSLLSGTSRLTRSDAAKAFYQALGVALWLELLLCTTAVPVSNSTEPWANEPRACVEHALPIGIMCRTAMIASPDVPCVRSILARTRSCIDHMHKRSPRPYATTCANALSLDTNAP